LLNVRAIRRKIRLRRTFSYGGIVARICFLGAGSTVFSRNVLGDCVCVDGLRDAPIALVDVDADRLHFSAVTLRKINRALRANGAIVSMCDELIEAHGDFLPT